MTDTVFCSPQFLRQLSQLEKAGGKATRAVKQAELITQQLNRDEHNSLFLRNKQTNSGENRLKNIEKYDLGAGYRLVCRRHSKGLSLEFIGTHDKTDLWINHNRIAGTSGTKPAGEQTNFTNSLVREFDTTDTASDRNSESDLYEENLKMRIDDKLLHQIFCGFSYSAQQKR